MSTFRRVILCFHASWCAISLWLGSDAGLPTPSLLIIVFGAVVLLALWLVFAFLLLRARKATAAIWIEPLVLTAVLVLIFSGTAFHLRFAMSKPFLTRYADRLIATRESQSESVRVGLFVVRETKVLPGNVVRLITTPCMSDDCGLVFSGKLAPPVTDEDIYAPISDGWWRWRRSW